MLCLFGTTYKMIVFGGSKINAEKRTMQEQNLGKSEHSAKTEIKGGEFFEDVLKDGGMIINKAECDSELQRKERTSIGKNNTEELRDVTEIKKKRPLLLGTGFKRLMSNMLRFITTKNKIQQKGLRLHKEGQQEVPEEKAEIGEFFEDIFKDGDRIINKAECEPKLKKKERTGKEELRNMIEMKKKRPRWFCTDCKRLVFGGNKIKAMKRIVKKQNIGKLNTAQKMRATAMIFLRLCSRMET